MADNPVSIGEHKCGAGQPLLWIAGPCVMESPGLVFRIAEKLKADSETLGFPLVFKSSFDKANRSSGQS